MEEPFAEGADIGVHFGWVGYRCQCVSAHHRDLHPRSGFGKQVDWTFAGLKRHQQQRDNWKKQRERCERILEHGAILAKACA